MSRRFYRPTGPARKTRVNHEIRLSPIKVIDQDDRMLGEMPTDQARQLAQEAGLDLVEINAETRPPLCKITDYGKYKYELSKKENAKKKNKGQELKEVRLGRSMKIDDHDVSIRVNQARKFLLEGHKVHLVAQFKGREMAHKDIGIDRLKKIADDLDDIAKVETPLRSAGRRMSFILAPDKTKIESYKRKLEKEKKAKAAEAEADSAQPDQAQAPQSAPDADAPPTKPDASAPTDSSAGSTPVDTASEQAPERQPESVSAN